MDDDCKVISTKPIFPVNFWNHYATLDMPMTNNKIKLSKKILIPLQKILLLTRDKSDLSQVDIKLTISFLEF